MTIKILFLASDPTDAARLRLGEEIREIQDRLDDKDKFELKERFAVRAKDVLKAIVDFKPQIVHFSGHGMDTGELCLEDEQGNTQMVLPEALASLFRLVTDHVKCVVINTCFSEQQAKAIAEHILFVIGMKKAIGDRASIEFATGFYTALESDQSIENIERAFELGRVAIQLSGIPAENLIPTLIFGDPRKRFRLEVEQVLSRQPNMNSTSAYIYRIGLRERGRRMGLSEADIESATNDVLKSIDESNLKLKDYQQTFTEAIRNEFPLEDNTREALQYLQRELGIRSEDIAQIENKIISDPRWHTAEAFFNRGLRHFGLEEYEKAIGYYTRAIEIRPTYSGGYLERGATYYKMDEMEAAIEDYNHAIEINKNWEGRSLTDAYLERGLAYFYNGQKKNHNENMQAAVRDWTETIRLKPNYSIAYYNRASAYSALENRDEAINDFTQAIAINSGWGAIVGLADAYYKRASLYQEKGETEASDRDLREAEAVRRAKSEQEDLSDKGEKDSDGKDDI